MLRLFSLWRIFCLMSETFFTAEEVAEKLRLNKVTVHRWIRSGKLPAINLGGSSGYRISGSDVEALLWTEYGGIRGYFHRAARALYEAADAAKEYADTFDDDRMSQRGAKLREEANHVFHDAEHFLDLQGFYRPASPPRTLRELQPFMAMRYDAGNEDFQIVAIMVRDSIGDNSRTSSVQAAGQWLSKAEASNPPDTEHGRLVRIAGPLLMDHYRADGASTK
jgi:excisionase family DNA binding protein